MSPIFLYDDLKDMPNFQDSINKTFVKIFIAFFLLLIGILSFLPNF